MKRAAEQKTAIRETYVQSSLLWGRGGGVSLSDLRDLVATTHDYDNGSRVILEKNKVTVIEKRTTSWARKGVEDD